MEEKLNTLIGVVEKALGKNASYMTKKVLDGCRQSIKDGTATQHDLDQLAYWYAKDSTFTADRF